LILVDPGIDGSDLNQLADDVDRLGIPVVAGFLHPSPLGAYEAALDPLGEAARHVDVLVPGHGAVAEGAEVAARLAADHAYADHAYADHAYIDALRRGEEPVDARLGQDWLSGPHQSNVEQSRHSSG
jgi:hypothetical protein